MFNRIYQNFCFFGEKDVPDYFCNSFETTARFFSKILGLGGLRQLPNSPKGRAGPGYFKEGFIELALKPKT